MSSQEGSIFVKVGCASYVHFAKSGSCEHEIKFQLLEKVSLTN